MYILPVSFAQQRLWFLSRLQPDSTAYNVFGGLVLRGTLDVAVLERSFHEIVRRHETLRTTFLLLDGEPVQVVSAEGGVRVTWSDLQDLEQAESEREVDRLLSIESQHAFDLTRGPLLRLTVLRLSPKEHVLIYVMHHIITDGWSERVFTRELCLLYQAFSADEPSPLPDLPIQYGDFAHWQRESLQGETLERLLSYWRQKLAGVSGVLDLPAANRRPPVFSHRGASERFAVTAQIAAALKELGSVEGATLFATLLAAFGVLLSRLSGDEDLLVGSPVANRNPVELEPLIGFFAGTLVLRLDLSGNPSFRELLRRVRDTAYEAQEHQDLPFEKLVNELGLERDPSRNPLVQVVFTMGNIPMEQADLGGLVLAPRRAQAETAKFDLTLGLTDTGNGLAGYIEYCTDLFDAAAIRRMLECFQVLLEAIAEGPERIILDLPLLTSRERQTLLFEWSGGSFSARPEACLHEIFEGQARRAPGATAVACGDESLSYGDLDRRAGILAAHLLGLLPRPLERVGICLDRSLATVVTILGILKAGAAYVPLDPTYPRERLDYLLRDSGVQALVTDRKILGELPELGGEVVTIDSIDWDSAKPSVLPPLPAGGAGPEERPAYVIYTSGSTGNPK
ncbi:MAG TPA: condensation domain-containing protein, partial [Thermoanaerobaculia bacterium]|nr:condensation domain-containing protein [Thermoanaerobaculia bacterium]